MNLLISASQEWIVDKIVSKAWAERRKRTQVPVVMGRPGIGKQEQQGWSRNTRKVVGLDRIYQGEEPGIVVGQ